MAVNFPKINDRYYTIASRISKDKNRTNIKKKKKKANRKKSRSIFSKPKRKKRILKIEKIRLIL